VAPRSDAEAALRAAEAELRGLKALFERLLETVQRDVDPLIAAYKTQAAENLKLQTENRVLQLALARERGRRLRPKSEKRA
jgi:hypothetical protein